jgi:hypothetical protein
LANAGENIRHAVRMGDAWDAVYVVELLRADGDGSVYQFGAFTSREEAERVLALLEREGRHSPLSLNAVPVYSTAEEWEADR